MSGLSLSLYLKPLGMLLTIWNPLSYIGQLETIIKVFAEGKEGRTGERERGRERGKKGGREGGKGKGKGGKEKRREGEGRGEERAKDLSESLVYGTLRPGSHSHPAQSGNSLQLLPQTRGAFSLTIFTLEKVNQRDQTRITEKGRSDVCIVNKLRLQILPFPEGGGERKRSKKVFYSPNCRKICR